MVTQFHLSRHSGSFELMEYYPTAHFVQQHCLNTTMQGIDPRLMILRRFPNRDDVLSILKEAHPRTNRIVRTTTEAVVAGHFCPRIDYSFHCKQLSKAVWMAFTSKCWPMNTSFCMRSPYCSSQSFRNWASSAMSCINSSLGMVANHSPALRRLN